MAELLAGNSPMQSEQGASWLHEHKSRIWEWNGHFTHLALCDVADGLRRWPLWGRLGWQDVVLRYRRSMLGPLWLTLSMGVMVFTLGLLYGGIFKIDTRQYLPFLTIGLLAWGLITGAINEGCQTFIEADWLIKQVDLPLFMFPLRVVWRNLILFLHNAAIYLVVVFIFDVRVNWALLLAIPGLLVLLANALWCATLLGMLAARFRDLSQIVASLLQVAFFVTPIIWTSEQVTNRRFLVDGNPFFHFIQLLREPMLGRAPTLLNWEVALGITLLGYIGTFFFYRRYHGRIAYWV